MRFLTVLFLLFISSFNISAQDAHAELKSTFTSYYSTVIAKDNGATLEYIYPKLFDHFPKSAMQDVMDKMYADTTMDINFGDNKIGNISKPLLIDDVEFRLLTYSFTMTMKMNYGKDVNEENKGFADAMLLAGLIEKFGAGNVSLDETTSTATIRIEDNKMFCIKNPEYTGWKFLERKENLMEVAKLILPKKVIKKLN